MRRQHGIPLDDRIVLYLQMAGLYYLARLNETWFRLDEPLVSAFVERWRPETHTFSHAVQGVHDHAPGCSIPVRAPIDSQYVSGCLTDFARYVEGGRPAWETFSELPQGADNETVRRYAHTYIMMLLSTQLFGDKSGTRLHIHWLPYVARLEDMGQYSWGSAALSWLFRCMCRMTNRNVVKLAGPLQLLQSWIFWRFPGFRPEGFDVFHWPLASSWSGYQPTLSDKGPRVAHWRLRIDLLQHRRCEYLLFLPEVVQVVHPEILEPRHMSLWRAATALIYFAVIEWHPVDRVLPQFGGVQGRPRAAVNIDFLMSKDGRGEDRWFPHTLQFWHLHWADRAQHVLQFDVVADPGPSHEYLDWWYQYGRRFLSPEHLL
ncbi:serine/threonine-protein phosphatase 7 long form homolog [Arachis hypogaea]|uniref:serine/threonine-protein phosphatase 7 long form homolog n=1 Tax=Arachis hypogaea TaxID=3818 RepID=UPI0007AF190B